MDEDQIYSRLAKVFEDVLDQEPAAVSADLLISEMDGWDSLTNIRLILTIEKEFRIKFLTSDLDNLHSAGDLVAVIKARSEN
jgi:acyl carrier protein